MALAAALKHPNVTLVTGARVSRLVEVLMGVSRTVEYVLGGESKSLYAKLVILSAGAVQSAAMLLRSGLANRSDQVGRNFVNHNLTAVLAVSPWYRNDSISSEDVRGLNDLYLGDGEGGSPLGNIQLLRARVGSDPQGEHSCGARVAARAGVAACDRLSGDEREPRRWPRAPPPAGGGQSVDGVERA